MVLRQTRGLIDKTLLENARQHITGCMESAVAASVPVSDVKTQEGDVRFEKIDRQKNVATILKLIEMKSDNKGFMRQMQVMLQEAQT